jgi:hypothetical protein
MFKATFWLESSDYKLMHITGFQLNFSLKFKRVQSFIHEILKKTFQLYADVVDLLTFSRALYKNRRLGNSGALLKIKEKQINIPLIIAN